MAQRSPVSPGVSAALLISAASGFIIFSFLFLFFFLLSLSLPLEGGWESCFQDFKVFYILTGKQCKAKCAI